jgi:hypothetical protein
MVATLPVSDTQMRTVVMDVGPDLAAEWLEGNVHNRPIHQKRVDLYAADMKAGRWKLTHQGIAFDVNRILRDGQHRLWAVLNSGCVIRIPVTFNLPFDAIEEIDNVKARSTSDRMNISGRFEEAKISTNQVSVLRAMVRGLNPERALTYHDECDLMQAHLPAIRFALERLTTNRIKGVSSPTVCAVVARAWYSQDLQKLERFCEVLRSGMAEDSEAVVIMLRDYLSTMDRSHTMRVLRDIYGRAERALQCFLTGRSVTILRPCQAEVFPLPQTKGPAA